MRSHKQSGWRPCVWRMRLSVNRWRWVCFSNKQWHVCSTFLSLTTPHPTLQCVTSKSNACWLDLHLIQLVSSISVTLKNSHLFALLHRHLIPGNIMPGAEDTHTHTPSYKHRHAQTFDTWGSCNDKMRQGKAVGSDIDGISETKKPKRGGGIVGGRVEEGTWYQIDASQYSGQCNKMNLLPYCL